MNQFIGIYSKSFVEQLAFLEGIKDALGKTDMSYEQIDGENIEVFRSSSSDVLEISMKDIKLFSKKNLLDNYGILMVAHPRSSSDELMSPFLKAILEKYPDFKVVDLDKNTKETPYVFDKAFIDNVQGDLYVAMESPPKDIGNLV